jgi:hypothetical protein
VNTPIDDEFEQARQAWNEGGEERVESGESIFASPLYDRADVETKINRVAAMLESYGRQGVVLDGSEMVMDRLVRLCEIVLGDMDDQRRLEFESKLFDHYEEKLSATAPAIHAELMRRGVGPNGLIIPKGGRSL